MKQPEIQRPKAETGRDAFVASEFWQRTQNTKFKMGGAEGEIQRKNKEELAERKQEELNRNLIK